MRAAERRRRSADPWDSHHATRVLDTVSREVWGNQSAGQLGSVTPAYLGELADRLGLGPGHRVIDLGCGGGGLTVALAEAAGCEVVGVDSSMEAVAAARRRALASAARSRCRFAVGDMSSPPIEAGTVDAIVSFGSAYWSTPSATVPRWSALLREGPAAVVIVVTRILAPQGDLDRRLTLQRGLFAPHPDWEGALGATGFSTAVRDLSDHHADYVLRNYEALLRHRAELEAELGADGAAAYLAEDERLVSYVREGKLRRVEVVAHRSEGAT